jgi:cytochrome c-type biogenesis protein CcmF
MLRVWNLALAVATFLLVQVGTFLTRSGVIASVHAFTQSAIGPILLGFLLVVFIGAGSLFIWRADRLGPDGGLDALLSRESVFLGNNVVLVGLAFTVLIGTVFPLVVEAVNGQRVSVGAPYFNRMGVPLALTLLVLMGIGPLLPWAAADPRALARRVAIPAAVGLATIGVLGLVGLHGVGPVVTFGLAAFVFATIVEQFISGTRTARGGRGVGWLRGFGLAVARRRRLYGGLTVHLGVALAAVAIAGSSAYTIQGERSLRVGESLAVGDYTATLVAIEPERTPRRMAITARVALDRGGTDLGVHAPALSFYPSASQAIGTPSVETGALEDAYLVLASVDDARTTATIRLAVNPLVLWLWVAGGVMLTGALVAGWPGRRRRVHPVEEPVQDVAEEVPV